MFYWYNSLNTSNVMQFEEVFHLHNLILLAPVSRGVEKLRRNVSAKSLNLSPNQGTIACAEEG